MLSGELLRTRHYLTSDLSHEERIPSTWEHEFGIFVVHLIVFGDMWNLDSFDSRCLHEIKIVHKKKIIM